MARRLRGGRRRTPRRASGPRASRRRSRRARRQRRDHSCRPRARPRAFCARSCSPGARPGAASYARGGSRRRARRGRCRRDVARQGLSHTWPPQCAAGSARLGADGGPRARRDAARAAVDARAPGADSGQAPAALRSGRNAPGRAPAVARGLRGDDRVRDRAHFGPRRARLAAPGDRVRPLSPCVARRRATLAPRATGPGRGVRDVPAARLHRSEAVLDRGARRAGADARRVRRAGRRRRRARGVHRHRTPRSPQRPDPRRRPVVRVDPA